MGDVRGVSVACIRPANIVVVVTEAPFRNDKIMSVMGTQERSRLQHLPATGYLTACPGAARSSQLDRWVDRFGPPRLHFLLPIPSSRIPLQEQQTQSGGDGRSNMSKSPRVRGKRGPEAAGRNSLHSARKESWGRCDGVPSLSVIHALC